MSIKLKRFLIDIAGYGLILLGIISAPIPGPGGIPLVLAGLWLLSIHNAWAQRLRERMLKHGGSFAEKLFPPNKYIQMLYDLLVVVLLGLVAALITFHAAIWQISLAVGLFFLALTVAGMNRDRAVRLRKTLTKRK